MGRSPSAKGSSGPPPAVMAGIRHRLSDKEVRGLEMMFTLRSTTQQVDNALSAWMADTVGSLARFQILMALWTTKKGISHKDIVAAMGVTRATVSGLMSALESEGFVKSHVDPEDGRRLIARLTAKGETAIREAFDVNLGRFRKAFASLSPTELEHLADLLRRFRQGFAGQG